MIWYDDMFSDMGLGNKTKTEFPKGTQKEGLNMTREQALAALVREYHEPSKIDTFTVGGVVCTGTVSEMIAAAEAVNGPGK